MKKILASLFLLCACATAQAQIVGTLPFQLQNNTTADATQVMADFNKILTDVNTNGAKNGVNTDITALNALTVPITPTQGGSTVYYASTSTGTANAQVVTTPIPTGFTLGIGKRVTFIAGFTNTGAMTLNVNSTGATNVFRMTPSGPVALIGGEVVAGNYIEAVFDGTRFQLYTNASTPMFGPLTNLVSATTTDLGTISSHNVQITGTTTITAFGSSAIITYPVYRIRFSGVLTLTHNGTSLILPGSADIVTAANDTAVAQYLGSGNWQVVSYSKVSGAAVASAAPTIQRFIVGSGTYTTPANTRWIRIRLVGGGGGGGGGNSSVLSGAGGATTFSGGSLSAAGGGGASTSVAGAGGLATNGNVLSVAGGSGNGSNGSTNGSGAGGGNSCLGGAGGGGIAANGTGQTAGNNTGSGGGGGAFSGAPSGGGGAGACIEHIIASPAASYTYAVGAFGSASSGSGGGGTGGNGAQGLVIVEEHY